MKIVYLANIRLPTEKAHGLQIMKMCEAFADQHEVELVVPGRHNHLVQDPFEFYGVKKNFRVTRVSVLDLIGIIPRIGFWLETLTYLLNCWRFLYRSKPDLIYSREPFSVLVAGASVLELHTFPKKIHWIHRRIWQKARALVVLTNFIKNDLVKFGVNEKKIFVAPDGVDLSEYANLPSITSARQKLALPAGKKLIGYVGMLTTYGMEKGIATALAALPLLDNDVELVLVGGQEKEISFYKKLANRLGIMNRVRFIGKVPHQRVPEYLASFDVLIAPFPRAPHYEFYMSPLKIFEYMAATRPMVVSDLPSLREVLDEQTCMFCQPGSAEDLARKIGECLHNEKLRDKIAQEARRRVASLTWEIRAKNILVFLNF